MLLRIEDLDPQRSRQEYIDSLREDLIWLGLDWDEEMPLQSTRSELYARYFSILPVYPCFCSRNELHAASAPHASDGTFIYTGACRSLTDEARAAQQRKPAWRVIVPDQEISFKDGLCGFQKENLVKDCGDFILRRSDGVYAYQLAVVCDDALGGVTEIVRGKDLLASTPRQIWLYEALGFTVPQFYHVPLLLAPDGKRLSKREKSLDMSELRLRFSPEELIGRIAFHAGLLPHMESVTAKELVSLFSWEKIKRENVIISPDF